MLDLLFISSIRDNPSKTQDFGDFTISHVDRVLKILEERGYKCSVAFGPKEHIPAHLYLYTNCIAITNFPWMSKYGLRCYHVHGAGLFKDYAWKRQQHTQHDVILFSGEGMKRKYEVCHPRLLKTKKHQITGYAKYDKYVDQRDSGTARERLANKYKLTDLQAPIVLFAPTWEVNNNKLAYLIVDLPNVIFGPRKGAVKGGSLRRCTYDYDKSLEIAGADAIITDVSALGNEAARLGKPILQLATEKHRFTHMKNPLDLVIPELPEYGEYILGPLVKQGDPVSKLSFWTKKIEDAIAFPPDKRAKWGELAVAYDDNENSKRCADFLEQFILERRKKSPA